MGFWDFLRPVSQVAWDINMGTEAVVSVLSVAIFVISLLAYRRTKSKRLMLVSAAFFFFALKLVLKFLDQFISPGFFFSRASEAIVELVILGLLFFAIFRK